MYVRRISRGEYEVTLDSGRQLLTGRLKERLEKLGAKRVSVTPSDLSLVLKFKKPWLGGPTESEVQTAVKNSTVW